MADDDGFNEETFKPLSEREVPEPATPPAPEPPAEPPVAPTPAPEPPKEEPKPADEPKKDEEPAKPKEDGSPKEPPKASADDKKPEEGAEPPKAPEAPATPSEEAKPLTKDDVTSILRDIKLEERSTGKELEDTTNEVLNAYYPDGLSNTLIDQKSGKELRTPQDVVDASGGEMSTEEAAQWLMNEQYKLDQEVKQIKDDARKVAETTVNFKRDAITVLQKYDPLFKAYPQLQTKVWNKMMKQVKADEKKGVILSAPDVLEYYDDYLEPYQQAFEFNQGQSATAPTPSSAPEPPKPTAEDRMDEGGDGGITVPDDPNDFAQQVNKELAKEI